jgi:hypothetical protein
MRCVACAQWDARFGPPRDRMASALRRALALRDDDVIGCVAQLATVADARLAALLSASYRRACMLSRPVSSGVHTPGSSLREFRI